MRLTKRDDPLLQEVGWRLFKSSEIPSRLRRVREMEKTAEASPVIPPTSSGA